MLSWDDGVVHMGWDSGPMWRREGAALPYRSCCVVISAREGSFRAYKVCRPKINSFLNPTLCTTCIHLEVGSSRAAYHSVGQDPSNSKSNRLHVHIFLIWCFDSFEVCSIDSSKMIGKFPEVLNFSNSTGSSVTNRRFVLDEESVPVKLVFGHLESAKTLVILKSDRLHVDIFRFWSFPLQGNNRRIDKNMFESRIDKLHKIDRKLSKMTYCWHKMSELLVFCPKWQKYVNFM